MTKVTNSDVKNSKFEVVAVSNKTSAYISVTKVYTPT